MRTPTLDFALWVASHRLHIFPLHPVRIEGEKPACVCNDGASCKRIGRHPIHDDFAERATCEENAIRSFWCEYPYAEIAVLTGQKTGIVALEICPSEDNPNPLRGYDVPPAPAIVNAGRTVRLYGAPEKPIKKRFDLRNGLALRGEGSFVVLPDAIAANGGKYEWATGQTLKVPILPLPSYFVEPPSNDDEPEFTAEWHGTDNQPTPEECAAWNEDPHDHDEPSRESFNPDEPQPAQPATNAAPKKGAISLGELLESEDSSDATICAPLGISFGDRPMLIVGAFGTAKTWVMIKLALEFATGRPLFGNSAWPINRPLRVFIFDYELNRRVYKKRLRELCETMGIDYQTIRNSIYYYERPKFFLTDQGAFDRFLEESKDFDVILGDALRGAAPDVDENKSEFRKNLDILHDVATAGNKFVCWLHHAGKDENSRFRGTSGIGDAAGVMFTVTNDNKDRRGPKKLHHEKLGSNGDDFVDDFFIQLKRDEREDGKGPMRITYVAAEQSKEKGTTEIIEKEEWVDTMRKILIAVKKDSGIGKAALYKKVGGNRPTFDTVLQNALKKGRVENRGTKDQHKYHIAPPGQKWLDDGPRYRGGMPEPSVSTIPDTNETPAPDDAQFIVETEPEQAHETSAKKNQSNAVDVSVKMVVEYIRDNPGCTKSEINEYVKIESVRVAAVRDKAQREGLISWSSKDGNVITAKGRELLPPSAPSVTQDEPATPDTTNGSTDPTKGA